MKEQIESILKSKHIEALNLYLYGSQVYGTARKSSDYDLVVISQQPPEDQMVIRTPQMELNLNFYTPEKFQELVSRHYIVALECLSSTALKATLSFSFKLDLSTLRESISEKSSHSFVKAKKKMEVEQDILTGKKSLFHSLRILDFGIQIATHGKIVDFTKANPYWEEIQRLTTWTEMNHFAKPLFNQLSTEFKKLAPKREKS